jgi:hypothetical protein
MTFSVRYRNKFRVFGSVLPHSISLSKILSATRMILKALCDGYVTDFPMDLSLSFNARQLREILTLNKMLITT